MRGGAEAHVQVDLRCASRRVRYWKEGLFAVAQSEVVIAATLPIVVGITTTSAVKSTMSQIGLPTPSDLRTWRSSPLHTFDRSGGCRSHVVLAAVLWCVRASPAAWSVLQSLARVCCACVPDAQHLSHTAP